MTFYRQRQTFRIIQTNMGSLLMEHANIGDIYSYSEAPNKDSEKRQETVLIISPPNSEGEYSVISGISKSINPQESWIFSVTSTDVASGIIEENLIFPIAKQTLIHSENLKAKLASLKTDKLVEVLKQISLRQTEIYYHAIHKPNQNQTFDRCKSRISYAGRVFDEKEMINLVDSSLDFWLTAGPYTEKFEQAFSRKLGVNHCSLVNSGSSANLLAFLALTSPKLENRRICRNDEVITVAAGFPTTVNPILQYGAIPVFVDIGIPSYNIDVSKLEAALSERTKAVMLAHTLGNPFDLDAVKGFCDRNNLWLIEDNCDALGSEYKGRKTGSFGDIATSSFYPPHHITMGEGGAVYTNDKQLKTLVESFRDWGRDCSCPSGKDNTCHRRFEWQLGTLPRGYDHKYIYSHLGYNLKATDMQAAIGCVQLDKLDGFVEARRSNWKTLYDGLKDLEDTFVLPEPTQNSDPSWFGFFVTLIENGRFSRDDIVQYLESKRIQTRMLFAGNYLRHPAFNEIGEQNGYRVVGQLKNTDRIMNDSFWVGVYPGMKEDMLGYIIEQIHRFCSIQTKR